MKKYERGYDDENELPRTGKISMFMGYQEFLGPSNHPKHKLIGETENGIDQLLYYSGRWVEIYCFESEKEMNDWYNKE